MREAHGDEEVMEVGLVGMEGGGMAQDAHAHDTYGIEHGDAEYSQREGDQADAPRLIKGTAGIAFEDIEHEDAHDDAHNEGASIADEHLTGATEDIMEEEGYQRGGTYTGQHNHMNITRHVEEGTKNDTGHDAVATAVAVNTVDEVDGIDETNDSDDGKRNGGYRSYMVKSP